MKKPKSRFFDMLFKVNLKLSDKINRNLCLLTVCFSPFSRCCCGMTLKSLDKSGRTSVAYTLRNFRNREIRFTQKHLRPFHPQLFNIGRNIRACRTFKISKICSPGTRTPLMLRAAPILWKLSSTSNASMTSLGRKIVLLFALIRDMRCCPGRICVKQSRFWATTSNASISTTTTVARTCIACLTPESSTGSASSMDCASSIIKVC